MLAFNPARNTGIAALANTPPSPLDALVIDALLADEPE